MWLNFSLFANVEETVLFKSPPVIRKKNISPEFVIVSKQKNDKAVKAQIQRAMGRHLCDWAKEKSDTNIQTEKKNQDRMLK